MNSRFIGMYGSLPLVTEFSVSKEQKEWLWIKLFREMPECLPVVAE